MKKGLVFLVTVLMTGMAAYASHVCGSNDCTEDAKVDFIQGGRDGGFMVCFDKPVYTDSGFPGPKPFHCQSGPSCVTMDGNDPGAKAMLSLVLTAKTTNAKVDFYVRDNQCIYPTGATGWWQLSSLILDH